MVYRIVSWLVFIWTLLMGLGIFLAFLGIGDDCTGTGTALSECQAAAWDRGIVGLGLLLLLWFVVAAPLWIVRRMNRPKETVGSPA